MIAIVLAGGYAKRLWPLTLNKPKALLPLAGRSMIDYIVGKLATLDPSMQRIILSTNMKFLNQFQKWLKAGQYRGVELFPENSRSEAEKTGAVRALADVIEKTGEHDVLVVAGDNLFTDDLNEFLRFFREKHASTVALYRARDLDEARRGSEVTVGEGGMILEFEEKPCRPKTTLVGGCIYAFQAGIGKRLREYLELHVSTDEPGRFIEWLCKQEPVYGYLLQHYLWDIGTVEAYKRASEYYAQNTRVFAQA